MRQFRSHKNWRILLPVESKAELRGSKCRARPLRTKSASGPRRVCARTRLEANEKSIAATRLGTELDGRKYIINAGFRVQPNPRLASFSFPLSPSRLHPIKENCWHCAPRLLRFPPLQARFYEYFYPNNLSSKDTFLASPMFKGDTPIIHPSSAPHSAHYSSQGTPCYPTEPVTCPSRSALELERRGGPFRMARAQYAHQAETYFTFGAPALSLPGDRAPFRHCAPTNSEALFN